MVIIGCDFHSGFQQLAVFDKRTGEIEEKKLLHVAEAWEFYRLLAEPAVVGVESGVPCQWFRRLLAECGHQLRVGDAGKIRAAEPRKQKTDRRDAELRALGELEMSEHAARRREHLLAMVAELGRQLAELDVRIAAEVQCRPDARRLMTHPGVGAQTADALSAGAGGTECGARRRATATRLRATGSEEESCAGQGDGGQETGCEVVLDAPQSMDICGAGTSCG